jgi:hypothetical protein
MPPSRVVRRLDLALLASHDEVKARPRPRRAIVASVDEDFVPGSIRDYFEMTDDRDPLRLAIVGFSLLEDEVNEALADAFDGALPREIRHTSVNARLALARALKLIPDHFADPLGRLKKLRDDFAHAKVQTLSRAHVRELLTAIRLVDPEIDKEIPELDAEEPGTVLAVLLLSIDAELEQAFEEARRRREREAVAMREWEERHKPRGLPIEEIRRLLAEAND